MNKNLNVKGRVIISKSLEGKQDGSFGIFPGLILVFKFSTTHIRNLYHLEKSCFVAEEPGIIKWENPVLPEGA